MPESRYPPPSTMVYFVEPNPASEGGLRPLGHYSMLAPPRINETVTLPCGLGAEAERYRVAEVIHHMPDTPDVVTDDDPIDVVRACTCVISKHVTEGDVQRVVAELCRGKTNGHVTKLRG